MKLFDFRLQTAHLEQDLTRTKDDIEKTTTHVIDKQKKLATEVNCVTYLLISW